MSRTSAEAATASSVLQHSRTRRAVRTGEVRKDCTQVALEWSLEEFLKSKWSKRGRASSFRRNAMEEIKTDHGMSKN